jgi:flagellar hook-length control protein FliK
MATPIKSSNVNGTSANGATNSPAMSDLMSRLSAQSGDAQSQQLAFSRWMEKHAIVSDGASAKAPQASATPPSSGSNEASRAAEQALARARQQAAANKNKTLDKPAVHAEAKAADPSSKSKTESSQVKPARKDATAKSGASDKADKSAKTDDKDKTKDKDDEVSFNTAMGDGVAVVRELTPPSSIQPGDSAGMMAWLASLTHGDLTQGKTQTALQQEAGDAQGTGSTQQAADDKLTDLLHAGKRGEAGQGIALDTALWQASGSSAQQAEAMMAQLGKATESRGGEGDPLAGLVSGGALKGATFSEIMNNATQKVPHESATLDVPFGSTDFAQALADKVSMWVGATQPDGSMTAELHLNPADMGPINVKISLDGQTAHVDFAAAALETRQAIEASLPMLSSALSDVGLSMTGGDVSSQTSQQQAFNQAAQGDGGSGRTGALGRSGDGGDSDTGLGMRAVSAPRAGRAGGLDLYA